MERTRGGVNGFWLDCCRLASCLGLWLDCCRLTGCLGLWLGGFARLGSLARLTRKKFLRFLNSQEFFFAQSQSRPTEALFTAQSGLTRELFPTEFHIDPRTSLSEPANKLRDTARTACALTASTGSSHSSLNFRPKQVLPSFYKNFIAI